MTTVDLPPRKGVKSEGLHDVPESSEMPPLPPPPPPPPSSVEEAAG